MKILILTGGALNISFARSYINWWKPDQVIAADAGLKYAKKLDLRPDIIVGDFDSCDSSVLDAFSQDEKKLFPCEKNDTDTGLAMKEAIDRGAKEVVILGGMGSRIDHMLGNLGQIIYGFLHGVKVTVVDSLNRISLVEKKQQVYKDQLFGDYVSLIPMNKATGITLRGFKYPLDNDTLVFHESWGISNELKEEEGFISYNTGCLFMIESKDKE